MRLAPLRFSTFVASMIVVLPLAVCDGDDEQDVPPPFPAQSDEWQIFFEGHGGAPGERSSFEVKLAHDGAIVVRKARPRKWRTVFDGKLTDEEVTKFFATSREIIAEHRRDRRKGEFEDGWIFSLGISAGATNRKASYSRQGELEDADPKFAELAKIINAHLPKDDQFPE